MAKKVDLSGIGLQLDAISLERLEEAYPGLADELEQAVSGGATADSIRRYALARGMPKTWAAWLEQAARAVASERAIGGR